MTPEEIEACVDATAAAMKVSLAAEHRPGVLHYFGIAASMADLLNAHVLDLTDEPAPVFVPVSPPLPLPPGDAP